MQWERCSAGAPVTCTSIPAATGTQYIPTSNDTAHRLRIKVTATNSWGTAIGRSQFTGIVGLPTSLETVGVRGTRQVGFMITAHPGAWLGDPVLAYQWQRCEPDTTACAHIPGATTDHYLLTPADAGSNIRFLLTATNPVGSVIRPSGKTRPITP